MQETYKKYYIPLFAFSVVLMLIGILYQPTTLLEGVATILSSQDVLITDYVEIAGIGSALFNAGVVTALSTVLLYLSKEPFNGMTIVTTSLMAGFALFGKNFLNIWPIVLGTWLYAKYKREKFSKYVSVSLLATALSPLVSYMALGSDIGSVPVGILTGIIIGFVIPPLSGYTYKIQNGINLYNVGFACGLVALMIVPILTAFGDNPPSVLFWNTEGNFQWELLLGGMFLVFLTSGLFFCGEKPMEVLKKYRQLLKKSGRSPSDFLRMFGIAPVLVNMALTGFIGMVYILLIDGNLNGPTVGGIFAIVGFSAFGKHPRNILPVMFGVFLGAFGMHLEPNNPSLQLAGLFGTTLAPISGQFGAFWGVVAGFVHASLVLQTGGPVAGVNLYNNGFSGGLVAIVFYPLLTEIFKRRRIKLRDKDYFDLFEEDEPIDLATWNMSKEEILQFRREHSELKEEKRRADALPPCECGCTGYQKISAQKLKEQQEKQEQK